MCRCGENGAKYENSIHSLSSALQVLAAAGTVRVQVHLIIMHSPFFQVVVRVIEQYLLQWH